MVDVAQSVRVTDCGSEGRGFESHLPPLKAGCEVLPRIFFLFVSEFVSQLPLLSKQKSRTACTCFQQCNMGKGSRSDVNLKISKGYKTEVTPRYLSKLSGSLYRRLPLCYLILTVCPFSRELLGRRWFRRARFFLRMPKVWLRV